MFTLAYPWLMVLLLAPLVVRWLVRPRQEARPFLHVPFLERLSRASGVQPAHELEAQFGEVAGLSGFTLSDQQIATGEILSVRLYWLSRTETNIAYRAFVHLGENPIWGQHDDDPACRLPMTLWRTGQTAVGQFRIAPSPDTPPGDYPLVVGLYHPTTGERLSISDKDGHPIGDSLILTTVQVETP